MMVLCSNKYTPRRRFLGEKKKLGFPSGNLTKIFKKLFTK